VGHLALLGRASYLAKLHSLSIFSDTLGIRPLNRGWALLLKLPREWPLLQAWPLLSLVVWEHPVRLRAGGGALAEQALRQAGPENVTGPWASWCRSTALLWP